MKYIQYNDFLDNYDNYDKNEIIGKILVGKINNSYLIGPRIIDEKDYITFFKRVKSNSVYDISKYKKVNDRKIINLLNKYQNMLCENEIIEIKNNKIKLHTILKIPENKYEK